MATQLDVINEALSMLGDNEIAASELANLSQERARVMASAFPGAVDACLQSAPWIFASRIIELKPVGDTGEEQEFAAPGFLRAFEIPDDHLRTNWVRNSPGADTLPIQYHVQDGYWHANTWPLFASYVSHQYRSPETWPELFAKTVSAYLAFIRGPRIRPAADENALRIKYEMMMDTARTQDASERPFSRFGSGRLSRSRGSFGRGYGGHY